MKRIPLSGKNGEGLFAVVDDDDFDLVAQCRWHFSGGYAVTGRKPTIWMHRVVNVTPEGAFTDHINGDRLDNRKANLRSCSHAENMRNRKVHKNNSSGVRGVRSYPGGRWVAYIKINRRSRYIGIFPTLAEASAAREAGLQRIIWIILPTTTHRKGVLNA